MSERKINLEEILQKHIRFMLEDNGKTIEQSKYLSDKIIKDEDFVYIKNAMKEACKKILELAAENAKTNKELMPITGVLKSIGTVNKQSILDTINQVK